MTALTARDEYAHQPSGVPNWQENYVWHAWNPTTRSGWNLHLGNILEENHIDVRAHVVIDGTVTAGSLVEPGAECFAAPSVEVDVIVPFERMRLRFEGLGRTGPDSGGWFGAAAGAGTERFGFEIDLVTEHPVFDGAAYPIFHDSLDVAGNHYEAGARWRGRLWSGDNEVEASGLLIRDHSWGGRVWAWEEVYWVPMVFDEGRSYRFNWCQRSQGEWRSMSVQTDSTGKVEVADELWIRLGGRPVPRQFWSAEVLRAGAGGTSKSLLRGDIHLPVRRARSGAKVGLSDMYSTVLDDWGQGFSTVQIFPTADEVAAGFASPTQAPAS
jgi:hypothetical protein